MLVIPSDHLDILGKRAFGHVATQTTERQKYRNLKRDKRISVSAHWIRTSRTATWRSAAGWTVAGRLTAG